MSADTQFLAVRPYSYRQFHIILPKNNRFSRPSYLADCIFFSGRLCPSVQDILQIASELILPMKKVANRHHRAIGKIQVFKMACPEKPSDTATAPAKLTAWQAVPRPEHRSCNDNEDKSWKKRSGRQKCNKSKK